MYMRRSLLFVLLVLGACPSRDAPPISTDTTDAPIPPPVVPPPPLIPLPPPEPPPLPPAPPKPDSVKLVIFPLRIVINVSETSYLCVAWKFPNGHYAMAAEDVFRNLVAYDHTCDVELRRWYDPTELQVTEAEQREANYRTQLVGWRGNDSLVVNVQSLNGGIMPHMLQAMKWKAWSESNPRRTHSYDSTQVFARYGDQEASAWVIVRSMGWFTAP